MENDPIKRGGGIVEMEFHNSRSTIPRALRDLGLIFYCCRVRNLLPERTEFTTVQKDKKLRELSDEGGTVRIFTDKRNFTVEQVINRKND